MIKVNNKMMEWRPGITLADAIDFYHQFDELIYDNPDLMCIIGSHDYIGEDHTKVLLNDGDFVILMYEFYGG